MQNFRSLFKSERDRHRKRQTIMEKTTAKRKWIVQEAIRESTYAWLLKDGGNCGS